jgi:hypothetical protein
MLGWDGVNPYPTDAQLSATTLRHGNFDYVTNTVKWDPAIASHALPKSLYLTEKPAFFNTGSGYNWPWVNPMGATKLYVLPANLRRATMPGRRSRSPELLRASPPRALD